MRAGARMLGLVARGLSNREIVDVLVVTKNTAKYHVASPLNTLGAASARAEAAPRAIARGLLVAHAD